ncbi:hypothetical protein ACFPYI_13530 [Halomarina salina]|uniref:DUF7967 domain-containing protein n=1 Tax=Halomarina salina TaxID=1872699 RepID=A0ABD5RP11_9EURY|nr:hypothetical protein [Halomarina salina]
MEHSGASDVEGADASDDAVRVWLVERTYSDDEQNLIILTYATPDGERDFRKERALTSFSGPGRETTAALDVSPSNLGTVSDEETRERYATEVERLRETHAPDDSV